MSLYRGKVKKSKLLSNTWVRKTQMSEPEKEQAIVPTTPTTPATPATPATPSDKVPAKTAPSGPEDPDLFARFVLIISHNFPVSVQIKVRRIFARYLGKRIEPVALVRQMKDALDPPGGENVDHYGAVLRAFNRYHKNIKNIEDAVGASQLKFAAWPTLPNISEPKRRQYNPVTQHRVPRYSSVRDLHKFLTRTKASVTKVVGVLTMPAAAMPIPHNLSQLTLDDMRDYVHNAMDAFRASSAAKLVRAMELGFAFEALYRWWSARRIIDPLFGTTWVSLCHYIYPGNRPDNAVAQVSSYRRVARVLGAYPRFLLSDAGLGEITGLAHSIASYLKDNPGEAEFWRSLDGHSEVLVQRIDALNNSLVESLGITRALDDTPEQVLADICATKRQESGLVEPRRILTAASETQPMLIADEELNEDNDDGDDDDETTIADGFVSLHNGSEETMDCLRSSTTSFSQQVIDLLHDNKDGGCSSN